MEKEKKLMWVKILFSLALLIAVFVVIDYSYTLGKTKVCEKMGGTLLSNGVCIDPNPEVIGYCVGQNGGIYKERDSGINLTLS